MPPTTGRRAHRRDTRLLPSVLISPLGPTLLTGQLSYPAVDHASPAPRVAGTKLVVG